MPPIVRENILCANDTLLNLAPNGLFILTGSANLYFAGVGVEPHDIDFLTDDATIEHLGGAANASHNDDGYFEASISMGETVIQMFSYEGNALRSKNTPKSAARAIYVIDHEPIMCMGLKEERDFYKAVGRPKDVALREALRRFLKPIPTSPRMFWQQYEEFRGAAERLAPGDVSAMVSAIHAMNPLYYLTGFAAECLFKSCLTDPSGHDLFALYHSFSDMTGLKLSRGAMVSLINLRDLYYPGREMGTVRYPVPESKFYQLPELLFAMLDELEPLAKPAMLERQGVFKR